MKHFHKWKKIMPHLRQCTKCNEIQEQPYIHIFRGFIGFLTSGLIETMDRSWVTNNAESREYIVEKWQRINEAHQGETKQ
jgi:hypothetical protein